MKKKTKKNTKKNTKKKTKTSNAVDNQENEETNITEDKRMLEENDSEIVMAKSEELNIENTSNEENNEGKSAEGKTKKREGVEFKAVHVREYERQYDGGGGVPETGGFPLGIDWTFSTQEPISIDNYEEARSQHRTAPQVVHWKKRKTLLNAQYLPDAQVKSDTSALHVFRKRTGCECKKKKKKCTAENGCECATNEIGCHTLGCGCARVCGNPQKRLDYW